MTETWTRTGTGDAAPVCPLDTMVRSCRSPRSSAAPPSNPWVATGLSEVEVADRRSRDAAIDALNRSRKLGDHRLDGTRAREGGA